MFTAGYKSKPPAPLKPALLCAQRLLGQAREPLLPKRLHWPAKCGLQSMGLLNITVAARATSQVPISVCKMPAAARGPEGVQHAACCGASKASVLRPSESVRPTLNRSAVQLGRQTRCLQTFTMH